jgi:hypothetical protein
MDLFQNVSSLLFRLTEYFADLLRRTTGQHMRENADLCAQRFPQKVSLLYFIHFGISFEHFLSQLIKFYQGHLRWKSMTVEEKNGEEF